MNPLLLSVVHLFIKLVLTSSVFTRIESLVHAWAAKELSGSQKRAGVLGDVEEIGIKSAEWAVRIAIELAIGKLVSFNKDVQP